MSDKNTLEELREEFINLYTKKEDMVSGLITGVYVLYTDLIGRAEFEVFNLDIQAKALRLKIKLAQAYLNRNESPDTVAIEQRIKQLWKEHEDKLNQMIKGIKFADSSTPIQGDVVEDCRNIYRMLVKKLHPDLHPELSEELQDMLIVAQAAYKNHDVNTLRQLAIKYYFLSDEEKQESETDKDLLRIQLEVQIENLRKEIEAYETSFPLNYLERLHDEAWVAEQQKQLQEKINKLKAEIEKMENMYSLIID